MKKIFALILCLMLLLVPLSVSAEEVTEGENGGGVDSSTYTDETPTEEEIAPPETSPEDGSEEAVDKLPEAPTDEGVDTPPEQIPEETPKEEVPKDTFEEEVKTVTDNIAKWLEENSGFISLCITIIGYGIVSLKKLGTFIKAAGVYNKNTITIAKDSKAGMENAAEAINNAANAVLAYEAKINTLLEKYEQAAEDKQKLEKEVVEMREFFKIFAESNVEFANELAELLGLSNIPNYKKEEIGARHLARVTAILEAVKKVESLALPAPVCEGVKEDVGEEA